MAKTDTKKTTVKTPAAKAAPKGRTSGIPGTPDTRRLDKPTEDSGPVSHETQDERNAAVGASLPQGQRKGDTGGSMSQPGSKGHQGGKTK